MLGVLAGPQASQTEAGCGADRKKEPAWGSGVLGDLFQGRAKDFDQSLGFRKLPYRSGAGALQEALAMIDSGEVVDMKTVTSLQALALGKQPASLDRQRRPEHAMQLPDNGDSLALGEAIICVIEKRSHYVRARAEVAALYNDRLTAYGYELLAMGLDVEQTDVLFR